MLWKIVYLTKRNAVIVYAMKEERPDERDCEKIWGDRINPGAKMHVSGIKPCTFVDLRELEPNKWVQLRAEVARLRDEAKKAAMSAGSSIHRSAQEQAKVEAFDAVLAAMTKAGVPLDGPPESMLYEAMGGSARG